MTDNHSLVKENWSLYRAGKITLDELLARNDEIALKNEVKEVMPRHIIQAANIMGGKAVDKDDERWNS